MFLRAPQTNDFVKPNRNQKCAFTNKKTPAIKPFKPPDDEKANKSGAAGKADSPFVAWVRRQPEEHAWHRQAPQEYILQGPPFKGISSFGAKPALKDVGASWVRNEDKDDDCEDKSILRGWWSAPDEKVLYSMLQMEKDDRGRRPWRCVDLQDMHLAQILQWLLEFGKETGTRFETKPYRQASEAQDVQDVQETELSPKKLAAERLREWASVPAWIVRASKRQMPPLRPYTVCDECKLEVLDQFADCACKGARWQICGNCNGAFRVDGVVTQCVCACAIGR